MMGPWSLVVAVAIICTLSTCEAKRIWSIAHLGIWGGNGYKDENGIWKGFSFEVMDLVCSEAKIDCVYIQATNKDCWNHDPDSVSTPGVGLMSHWFDACIGWVPTSERLNSLYFTKPHLQRPKSYFYVSKGKTINVFNLAGARIGFFKGSAYNDNCIARQSTIANNVVGNYSAIYLTSSEDMINRLQNGEVDAIFGPDIYHPAHHPIWTVIEKIDVPFFCSIDGFGLMARKDNPIIELWNLGLTKLINTNKYEKFCAEARVKHAHKGPIECMGI